MNSHVTSHRNAWSGSSRQRSRIGGASGGAVCGLAVCVFLSVCLFGCLAAGDKAIGTGFAAALAAEEGWGNSAVTRRHRRRSVNGSIISR